jgi:uncharacterized protein (TIGR02598 family)
MKQQDTSAFSLVEVTLALGVAAFSLITILGLMAVGLKTNSNSTSRTAGTSIMAVVVADIRAAARATPSATPSALYNIMVPARGTSNSSPQTLYFNDAGGFTITLGTTSRYQLNVTFPANPDPSAFSSTYADLRVTWPAAATPANAIGSAEMFAAFDRN